MQNKTIKERADQLIKDLTKLGIVVMNSITKDEKGRLIEDLSKVEVQTFNGEEYIELNTTSTNIRIRDGLYKIDHNGWVYRPVTFTLDEYDLMLTKINLKAHNTKLEYNQGMVRSFILNAIQGNDVKLLNSNDTPHDSSYSFWVDEETNDTTYHSIKFFYEPERKGNDPHYHVIVDSRQLVNNISVNEWKTPFHSTKLDVYIHKYAIHDILVELINKSKLNN